MNRFYQTQSTSDWYSTNWLVTNDTCDSITTTTIVFDPLIDWLPYKYKKYIPTWHLVQSYKRSNK